MGASKTGATMLPIAGFKDVYDVSTVDRALSELAPTASEALRGTYEKMLKSGGHALHRQAPGHARHGHPLRGPAQLRRGA